MLKKLRVFWGFEQAENAVDLENHSIDTGRSVLSHKYIPASNPQSPKIGEQRIVTRFAWLPIRTLNGDRRWLQRVHIRQIYLTSMRKFGFGSVWKSRWLNGDFVLSAEFEEIADRTN